MSKKILIIDSLTETFRGPIVRSGLQKSSKLDARAFSIASDMEVTYAYCGECVDREYTYTHLVVDSLGTKDRAMEERNNQKMSKYYLPKYLERIASQMREADYIIAHCHSIGMIRNVDRLVRDKRILYVIHDVIDLVWAMGFTSAVNNMRSTGNNMSKVVTNSRYSIERLNVLSDRGGPHDIMRGDEAFDAHVNHFVWTDVKPTADEIVTKSKTSAVIGRYETNKHHHKLYGYRNAKNTIVHYGVRDPRRDPTGKYYDRLVRDANAYAEGLSDEDLWSRIKTSQSIILPCYHEGFGFTAFEAGIFGVVPVILTKPLAKNKPHIHATSEYLHRANVIHYTADFNVKEDIHESIDRSLEVTLDERRAISHNLLRYFTVNNYVNERINLLQSATKSTSSSSHNSLESFLS